MDRKTLYTCVLISVFVVLVIVAAVLTVLYFSAIDDSVPLNPRPTLLIDHDGGADDAMALFITLLYEKYFHGPRLIALTTSHGNVNESQVFENTQKVLDVADRRDIPVYRGSNFSLVSTYPSDNYFGFDGLGDLGDVCFRKTPARREHAVNALIELSKKYEGELSVVVLGALTNIALAIRLDPRFISRLSHLYIAAGNIYISGEHHKKPEFNAIIDVEGYHVVAENSTPDKVTFIPFSPILTAHNISMEWRKNVLGAINTKIMHHQNQFERISNAEDTKWNLLDPSATAMVLNDKLIKKSVCSKHSIILCGASRGINTNDFINCSDSNAKIAYPGPEEDFQKFLYDVFSAETRL